MNQDHDQNKGGHGPAIREFRAAIRLLEREISHALAEQSACCGVNVVQCHALLDIAEHPGDSVGAIAARMDLDISTLSRSVDALVKAGLVTREPAPGNRRQLVIRLSDEGRVQVAGIDATCDCYYGRLLDRLPEDLREAAFRLVPALAEGMHALRIESGALAGLSEGGGDEAAAGCCPGFPRLAAPRPLEGLGVAEARTDSRGPDRSDGATEGRGRP